MTDLRKAAPEATKVLANALSIDFNDKRDWYSYKHDVEYATNLLLQALAQPEQNSEAYGYAKYLAECIWEKHYKEESPHWRPFDNTLGVLTQIDNMTCGLEKAQPEQKPVAPILLIENRGTPEERVIQLYTAPPNREWVGLTEKERDKIILGRQQRWEIAHMIEAKLQEKNGG